MSDPLKIAQTVAADIAVFADIGTAPPSVEQTESDPTVRFVRAGDTVELAVTENGSIVERFEESTIKHANFKALLASDRYGNLRDWSSKQQVYIDSELKAAGSLIDVRGVLNGGIQQVDVHEIDHLLASSQKQDSTRVLLIDGPAGIGKTQFIVGIAGDRARHYSRDRRPLILHVQSRGRTLSYLYDLIAYSLQRLRLDVTFDQVPVLAKHGLITIAIDGFDELADPDGYDLAWSQVNDMIRLLRGHGSIILAGRETFIGRERVLKDIASLRDDVDEVSVLTLQPPSKGAAMRWLENQGWSEDQLSAVEEFLEPSSLASLSVADLVDEFKISMVDIDECRFSGTASGGFLEDVVINQFDCRGGDLSAVGVTNLTVLTLIGDRETVLPDEFPDPTRVQDVSQGGRTLSSPAEIHEWITAHQSDLPEDEAGLIPESYREHEAIKLLHKACRLRQYWLRRGDDVYATRILDNRFWPTVEAALAENQLLRVENRQASGTDAQFIHVRQAEDILSENTLNEDVRKMYAALIEDLQANP
ncbi:hypothetical protein NLM16_26230 [Bradyrhizobium brasilense]|uniref:hypothetical protein n=1 Tax=Bradyrhizobium brasilense TaxID=1419277 RepID=UPI002877F0D5|nr:hypothetical protein [Bradyrhizobium brasilense]MCP3417607.1 hypothetical protein [Bradyrhizobium brasilense]